MINLKFKNHINIHVRMINLIQLKRFSGMFKLCIW